MKMIGQRERFGSHLGLERIQLVCDALGNPEKHLPCIHVAGTSGKGSVSAFLAEVLTRSGFKVGSFTSPHLEHYRERFRINGTPIDLLSLEKVVTSAEAACKKVEEEHPHLGSVTEFELATAAGFLYFHQSKVDLVVLETGLGGRLDATNVVSPVLTIITTIAFDHQDRLGNSLEEIAAEKGGIIKAGIPVISGVQSVVAETVLKEIALERGAPWRSINVLPWVGHGWGLDGGRLSFPGIGLVHVGLLGAYQLQNAATALLTIVELQTLGFAIPLNAIQQGFQEVVWPGRLEIVSRKPFVLLDGAHNEEGIKALVHSLEKFRDELKVEKYTFLFGMLHNKELSLLDHLLPLAESFIFSKADGGRLLAMEPSIMGDYVRARGAKAVEYPELGEALAAAKQTSPLVICGSLYLVGSVKRFLHPNL